MALILELARWLLLVAEICIAAPVFYLCIISLSAILTSRKRRIENARSASLLSAQHFSFAILIPAHNEEVIINKLLESLSGLHYPKELYTVHVVADNCTDRTAELIQKTGWAHVHERSDQKKRGKGYALNWLIEKLTGEQLIYDAYIILDADSVVEPGFLQAMARELAKGAQALQANNTVLNISEAPSAALRLVAMALVNHVRPLGRNGIGSTSTLTGNGMCLSDALLQRHPWQAFSIGEDYQYYLMLVEHGERVHYVPEAVVRSQMPITFAQMRTQDLRWESAEERTTRSIALRLLRVGLKERDFVRLEAVAELLTPPLSFTVGTVGLTVLFSLLLSALPQLIVSILLCAGLCGYIGTAFYLLRPPREVYMALLHAPRFAVWKLWVYFVLRRKKSYRTEWVRTSRTVS